MTAPDDVARSIRTVKELLSIAWSRLGDPLLTAFDRREARNQIKQLDAELRRYLQIMETHNRIRGEEAQQNPGPGPKRPSWRFLG
jgi:hypothetical protein